MTSCCSSEQHHSDSSACKCPDEATTELTSDFPILGSAATTCCGAAVSDGLTAHETPGYHLWEFVNAFIQTPAGTIPQVHIRLNREDRRGTVLARLGIGRDTYHVAPGIYAVGQPDEQSPVLVTANYKLTFDTLRSHLDGIHAWILVVDTKSINVWCAAGKGTFSTMEVAERVKSTGLDKLVGHRRLILPQLAATGVSGRQVKRGCGFEVVWGPVHAKDIDVFLEADMQATADMRKVTFSLKERVELIPVELNHMGKPTLYVVPALFLLSGLGSDIFSVNAAVSRGATILLAYLLSVMAGAVLAPVLLPWLPGRAFALKGAGLGAAVGALLSAAFVGQLALLEMLALTLLIMAVSSYLAMNFTGSTPFTSPTGVEKEMRRAIPAQAASVLTAIVIWVGVGFMG